MESPEQTWPDVAADTAPWWRQLMVLVSHPACPAVLALIVLIGLLYAFQQVVSQAVEQGNQRRMNAAVLAQGAWRCRLLHRVGDRAACAQAGEAAQATLASSGGRDGPVPVPITK